MTVIVEPHRDQQNNINRKCFIKVNLVLVEHTVIVEMGVDAPPHEHSSSENKEYASVIYSLGK